MFGSHRRDLKKAHEEHVATLMKLVDMLAEQVEYLRAQLNGHPYIGSFTPSVNPTKQPPAEPGLPKYLSEEEEDALALHLNGDIEDEVLAQLQVALNVPNLEADI